MRFSSFCPTWAALLISVNALAADDSALIEDDWVLSLNVQNLFDDDHFEFEPADPTVPLPGNRAERRVQFQVEYLLR